MFSNVYLASTQREIEEFLPKKAAYLSCHFSSSGKGLSNLPQRLPEDSLLLVDDSMPVYGHETALVAEQLCALVAQFSPKAILLDFQRGWSAEAQEMAQAILRSVPCPVAVTESYAKALGCAVFLSAVPADVRLEKHLSPWLEQGVFLELSTCGLAIEMTQNGCKKAPLGAQAELPLYDNKLFCHYAVQVLSDKTAFTLARTGEDLAALADEALRLGAMGAVGLFQELCR